MYKVYLTKQINIEGDYDKRKYNKKDETMDTAGDGFVWATMEIDLPFAPQKGIDLEIDMQCHEVESVDYSVKGNIFNVDTHSPTIKRSKWQEYKEVLIKAGWKICK